MTGNESDSYRKVSAIAGQQVIFRSSDHLDLDRPLRGTVVRIVRKEDIDWHYPSGLPKAPFLPMLLKLEPDISIEKGVSVPAGHYRYALLGTNEAEVLEFLKKGYLDELIPVYLLDEERLSGMGASPETGRLDIRCTYYVAKGVELRLVR